ncbi:DUF2235 domain-containing protein [Donghicola mangrovi]|uniref:DUF2235 domain-containing protein n=1 Tax=Donghicola mangrovi TaxID=2729614 RepID=A0A850QFH7_9RHOB|nr:DUF2235 domain-containing protein [Donghicola mangrovi]NVO25135.1 DUF2235 domain-containing protein [Donghicola mangrovi]
MRLRLSDKILGWLRASPKEIHAPTGYSRQPITHVIIIDGTLSSLTLGMETNAGLTYRLLREVGMPVSVYYEAGIQLNDWRGWNDVMQGKGLNRQIRRAYGYLASRYHPGDRVFLFGYSRGAYAVRSLAGVIDSVGLLKGPEATVRNVRQIYRIYQRGVHEGDHGFIRRACHAEVPIEMIGVWDTVKALGNRLPYFAARSDLEHGFHDHRLGPSIRHGYQALALDETREGFAPILWETDPEREVHVEQVWFRGSHGDVGGQLGEFLEARPLSNIPLVWMLTKAEACGLPLPHGWRMRFPTDVRAPSLGTWRSWGKLFLARKPRVVGLDPSESLHDSVARRHDDFTWASEAALTPPSPHLAPDVPREMAVS